MTLDRRHFIQATGLPSCVSLLPACDTKLDSARDDALRALPLSTQ
jgi:hypothetical protein